MKALVTKREMEILQLIAYEYSIKEIASQLFIAFETALSHRKNLLRKLEVKNSAGLVRKAFELNLMTINNPTALAS